MQIFAKIFATKNLLRPRKYYANFKNLLLFTFLYAILFIPNIQCCNKARGRCCNKAKSVLQQDLSPITGVCYRLIGIVIIFHLDVILFVRCLLLFFFASLYQCTAFRCHTLSAIDRREEIPLLPATAGERY